MAKIPDLLLDSAMLTMSRSEDNKRSDWPEGYGKLRKFEEGPTRNLVGHKVAESYGSLGMELR